MEDWSLQELSPLYPDRPCGPNTGAGSPMDQGLPGTEVIQP